MQIRRRGVIIPRPRVEPLELLLSAGRRRNRYHVKSRLLLAGLKQQRCDRCGLTEWQGQPLSLELHHVNGDGLDNRLKNLLLLCPNCHSQTDTWGGRNKGRRERGGPPLRRPPPTTAATVVKLHASWLRPA